MRAVIPLLLWLGTTRIAVAQGEFPWKPQDAPPAIAGVQLRDQRNRLDSVLGVPESTQALTGGATALTYRSAGISVILTAANEVALIYLLRADAGDIGGVKLGVPKGEVLEKWGDPPNGHDMTAYYTAGTWAVIVGLDAKGETVTQLGIGLLANAKP